MVSEIIDVPQCKDVENCIPDGTMREITFKYDAANENDQYILKLIKQVISDNQPTCFNCKNYYLEPCFGYYQASCCRIHGCIEQVGNPHYDCDGSKCNEYKRQ